MKIKKVRVPSGKVKIRKVEKKVDFAKCANCKTILHGIPRVKSRKLKNLPKTQKRVSRIFGGYLCSKCCREVIRERARSI